jgi:hypothetical protein
MIGNLWWQTIVWYQDSSNAPAVTTLSDIADANGQRSIEEAFKGQKLSNRYSRLKWPRQPVITTKQWNLWKAALEAAFTSSGTVLKQQLGERTGPLTQVKFGGTSTTMEPNESSHQCLDLRLDLWNTQCINKHDTMWILIHLPLHQCMCLLRTSTGTLWFQQMWSGLRPETWLWLAFHLHAKLPQDESDDVDTFGDY